jgi:hypothetical protein
MVVVLFLVKPNKKEKEKTKLCKNCVWYDTNLKEGTNKIYDVCKHPSNVRTENLNYLVKGKVYSLHDTGAKMRKDKNLCGIDGKYFKKNHGR